MEWYLQSLSLFLYKWWRRVCLTPRDKTMSLSFPSVEETLVRPDRSEFKILQGLDCWGGKTQTEKILAALVVVFVVTDWSVFTLIMFYPSGVRTGRWGWPLYMLWCKRVPGPEELRLPNPGECRLLLSAAINHLLEEWDLLFRLEPWPINSHVG